MKDLYVEKMKQHYIQQVGVFDAVAFENYVCGLAKTQGPDRYRKACEVLDIAATNALDPFNGLPEIKKTDKVCILTHTDLDGTGAPVLLTHFLNIKPTIRHCANGSMSDIIKDTVLYHYPEYDKIVVCDISCTAEDAALIDKCEGSEKLILLDHHPSAQHLNKYRWAVVADLIPADSYRAKEFPENNGHSSGTSLLWDFLVSKCDTDYEWINKEDPIYNYVHLVASYDTWDWKNVLHDETPFKLNQLMYIYGIDNFEDLIIERFKDTGSDIIQPNHEWLLEVESLRIGSYLKLIKPGIRKGVCFIGGTQYSFVLVYATQYLNSVFELLLSYGTDISIIYTGTKLSFRTTKPNINLSEIASKFGGGGHTKAAGITIPRDAVDELMCETLGHASFYFEEGFQK